MATRSSLLALPFLLAATLGSFGCAAGPDESDPAAEADGVCGARSNTMLPAARAMEPTASARAFFTT